MTLQRRTGDRKRVLRSGVPVALPAPLLTRMNKDIEPVLDEISAVLKKHDMMGLVMVANRTHVDYRIEVEASWSCARLEKDAAGNCGVRVRSKLADYPSKAAQKECVEATVGSFVTFSDVMRRLQVDIGALLVAVSKQISFTGKSTRED